MEQRRGVGKVMLEVLKAKDLPNVQSFGAQDPYVVATLLPAETASVQTHTVASGGTEPAWNGQYAMQGDNDATALRLQIFNENMAVDDVIGNVELPVSDPTFGNGRKTWYPLAEGGRIQCRIRCKVLATPAPRSLGIEVRRIEGVRDASLFGTVDPYVRATLVVTGGGDAGEEHTARTRTIEGGGVSAVFDEVLSVKDDDVSGQGVRVEVWGENTAVDDLLGSVTILSSHAAYGAGRRTWHSLAGGGRIELAVHIQGGKAVTAAPLGVGSRRISDGREARSGPAGALAAGGAAAASVATAAPKPPVTAARGTAVAAAVAGAVSAAGTAASTLLGGDGEAACPRLLEEHLMLSVEVQKATGLKDTQTFGAQDPYLKVSLHAARGTSGVGTAAGAVQAEGSGEVEAEASDVGEQLPGCVATTGTAPGGGVAPVWSDDTQGGTQLPVDRCLLGTSPRARVLRLQLLNNNAAVDDFIGEALVSVAHSNFGSGRRLRVPVRGGGQLDVCISFAEPLTERNIAVGCRCERGPHWMAGTQDGGPGSFGTVLGFRCGDGTRAGRYPSKHPSLHAIVEWDFEPRKYFLYSIGRKRRPEEHVAATATSGGSRAMPEQLFDLSIAYVRARDGAKPEERHAAEMLMLQHSQTKDRVAKAQKRRKQRAVAAAKMAQVQEADARRRQQEALDAAILERERAADEEEELKLLKEEAELQRALQDLAQGIAGGNDKELRARQADIVRRKKARSRRDRERADAIVCLQKYVRRRAALAAVSSLRSSFAAARLLQGCARRRIAQRHTASLRATAWASNTIQRALRMKQARSELKRRRKDRHQRRLRAAVVRIQSFARVCSSRALVNGKRLQRRRWKKLHMPLAFSATQRVVARKRDLACRLQRLYRGHSIRTLVKMRRLGGVCVDVHCARDLPDVNFFTKMDPYVRATLLPHPQDGGPETQERTAVVPGGHTHPEWSRAQGNQLVLPQRMGLRPGEGGAACRVLIEVMNEGTMSDDVLGVAEVQVPFCTMRRAKRKAVPLWDEDGRGIGALVELTVGMVSRHEVKSGLVGAAGERRASSAKPSGKLDGVGFLVVEVHRAEGLQDVQFFGDMDPYVVATLMKGLDMGSQTSTARCMCAQDGGVAPRWGESLDRLLALMPGGDERHLRLEIWNENNTTDEFIGQCCVPLIGGPQWANGERGFGVPITAELNTGGTITFTLHRTPGAHPWPTVAALPPATVGEAMFGKKLFLIEVHRARGLEDIAGMMGKMRPFVVATTKPQKRILARTSATDLGDCHPRWSGAGTEVNIDNKLTLKVDRKTRALVLELWNDEPIVDRYLGCIDLPIEIFVDVRTFGGGRRQWFPLDSEGALECTFHAPLPPF